MKTLTVESYIVVGEDCRLVALRSSADHHMEHPIGSINVMFLKHTYINVSKHFIIQACFHIGG